MTEVIHFIVITLLQLIVIIGCIVAIGRLYVLFLGPCFTLDACKARMWTAVIAVFFGWVMLAGVGQAHDSIREALSNLCYLVAVGFGVRQVWQWRLPVLTWIEAQFNKGDCGCGVHTTPDPPATPAKPAKPRAPRKPPVKKTPC